MSSHDAGRRRGRHRLIAAVKGVILVVFCLSLAYTVGASFRLFSTTLERWALSVGLTLLLAVVALAIVADWLLDVVRAPDE